MEVEASNAYRYSKIVEPGVIRLIALRPSPDIEAPIQCSVIHGTLAEYDYDVVDHYVALSYVWGDETDKRKISIEGKKLEITASLDCALRHIRDRYSRMLRIWADGICINQNDVDDRNLQVAQMGSVYSTARHTIIFLGLSSPKCDLVLQTLQTARPFDSASSFTLDNIAFETTVEDDILSRPWFTRTWVLQELVLSLDPWVQIGSTRVRWDRFCIPVLSGHHPMKINQGPIWRNDSRNGLLAIHEARSKFRRGREDPLRRESITEKESAGEFLNYSLPLILRMGSSISDLI
jgi:hypothetical protein